MITVSPTETQRLALAWLTGGHAAATGCLVLAGYAGTGKTYVIGKLVEQMRASGRTVVLMAPTGRAAKVLAWRAQEPAHTIHKTIYAMDDLKESIETNLDGSETYKFYFGLKNNEDAAGTVYVVDEASMVSDAYAEGEFFRFGSGHLLKDLLQYIDLGNHGHDRRLILVGDPAQLPPIGSSESVALDALYLAKHYGVQTETRELTEVIRHRGDSGLLDNATSLREAIRSCRLNVLDIKTDKPDVRPLSHHEVVARYASFGGELPPDNSIVVAYSNRLVSDYNRDIRAHYFPGAVGPVPGDRLLVVANSHRGDVSLMNGDLVRLVSAEPSVVSRTITLRTKQNGRVEEKAVKLTFRDVVIELDEGDNQIRHCATTILENLLDSPERDLSSAEQKALYVDFKMRNPNIRPGSALFKDAIRADNCFNSLRVKYGYAMTCHKAQGGEWPHVFVDFARAGGVFNLPYFRWAYTAITRAKEVLYTINAPHFTSITLSTQPDVEGSSYKIRDDLFVLGSEVLEDVSVNSIPHGTPFLKRLFLAVSFLLENKGIVLEKVESYQFCEHYHFRRGEARTVFLLHYNAEEVVTSVLPASKSGGDFEEEMRTILEAVSRKYIVLEETPSAMLAGRPEALLSCEYVYIVDAYTQLVKCARKDAIVLTEATVMSPHHLHCAFTKGGHTAAVDYFFTARGRLTRAIPRQGVTTSAVLMQKILDYSTGTAAVV